MYMQFEIVWQNNNISAWMASYMSIDLEWTKWFSCDERKKKMCGENY